MTQLQQRIEVAVWSQCRSDCGAAMKADFARTATSCDRGQDQAGSLNDLLDESRNPGGKAGSCTWLLAAARKNVICLRLITLKGRGAAPQKQAEDAVQFFSPLPNDLIAMKVEPPRPVEYGECVVV